jgi:hypothetical protein
LTLTLNKSIGATRLNRKTGVPWSEPEANIPFGAVIQYVGVDGGNQKFTYMSELYRCPADILASALDGGKLPKEAQEDDAKVAPVAAPVAKPAHTLKFERLAAGTYSVARAKVPGGWLVALGTGVTFYPDANHAWDGESVD